MLTIFISLVGILQSLTVALGVGASTLAIVNFFVAIADGQIDASERKMMGVVYIILRVAMVAILLTTLGVIALEFLRDGLVSLSMFDIAQLFTLTIIFINAVLMTLHIMPSSLGPALQAGSWYSLGILMALKLQNLTDFSFVQFLSGYIILLIICLGVVHTTTWLLKQRRQTD